MVTFFRNSSPKNQEQKLQLFFTIRSLPSKTFFCDRFHFSQFFFLAAQSISSIPTHDIDHIKQNVMILSFENFVTNVDLNIGATSCATGCCRFCSIAVSLSFSFYFNVLRIQNVDLFRSKCNQVNTCLMHTKPN